MLRLAAVLTLMMALVGPHAVSAATDAMPKFNVANACKGNFPDAIGMHRTQAACIADEQRSQKELGSEWAKFSQASKADCLREVGLGAAPSYVELQTCLEMSLWAGQK